MRKWILMMILLALGSMTMWGCGDRSRPVDDYQPPKKPQKPVSTGMSPQQTSSGATSGATG